MKNTLRTDRNWRSDEFIRVRKAVSTAAINYHLRAEKPKMYLFVGRTSPSGIHRKVNLNCKRKTFYRKPFFWKDFILLYNDTMFAEAQRGMISRQINENWAKRRDKRFERRDERRDSDFDSDRIFYFEDISDIVSYRGAGALRYRPLFSRQHLSGIRYFREASFIVQHIELNWVPRCRTLWQRYRV